MSSNNINNIPQAPRDLNQWVVWKKDKKPRNAGTGALASVANPSTWGTFKEACEAVKKKKALGVGFVFTNDDPYVGIDLDRVIDDDGQITPYAQDIIDRFDSYTEISQSGHGIHVIICGKKPKGSCKTKGIEVYDQGRYFALTGNIYQGRDTIQERQGELDSLFVETSGGSNEQTPKPQGEPIQEGQRNSTLLSLAGSMRHRGMTAGEIESALREVNQGRCQPPLEEKELLSIVKSVNRYEPAASTQKPQGFEPNITSARALSEWDFEDLKFALPGMIPEGFTILAGKPKSGKSWWALQAAYSVAQGENLLDGSVCNRGRALVLGLEDSMRRLQDRVNKLYSSDFILHSSTKLEGGGLLMRVTMGRTEIPEGLDLAVKWPKIGDGGIEELEKYLDEHPDTRLIVIDIIKRITRKKGRGTTYDEDYDSIQPLQELAIKRGVAILGVHHTRKALSDDPIEMVSGTFGLTGGADSIIVVQRAAEGESRFSFSGRDILMQELAMLFNEKSHRWTCLGDADSHFISGERERIIECLGTDSLSPSEVSRLLGKNSSTTRTLLFKMLRDDQVEKDSKGKYSVARPKMDDRIFKKKGG